jgi:hypothetical protein
VAGFDATEQHQGPWRLTVENRWIVCGVPVAVKQPPMRSAPAAFLQSPREPDCRDRHRNIDQDGISSGWNAYCQGIWRKYRSYAPMRGNSCNGWVGALDHDDQPTRRNALKIGGKTSDVVGTADYDRPSSENGGSPCRLIASLPGEPRTWQLIPVPNGGGRSLVEHGEFTELGHSAVGYFTEIAREQSKAMRRVPEEITFNEHFCNRYGLIGFKAGLAKESRSMVYEFRDIVQFCTGDHDTSFQIVSVRRN